MSKKGFVMFCWKNWSFEKRILWNSGNPLRVISAGPIRIVRYV